MAGGRADRTEKPTAKRLRDARRKGRVARTRDLAQAAALGAVLLAMAWSGAAMVDALGAAMVAGFNRLGAAPQAAASVGEITGLGFRSLWILALVVGPIAAAAGGAAIAAHTLQGGWVFAPEALQPDWTRLNPATGIKKLGFSQGGLDTLKMAAAVTALTVVSVKLILAHLESSVWLARLEYLQAASIGWTDIERLLERGALVLAAVALVDYGLQRWRFNVSMRMTKQEVRDDTRQTEGNPEVKGRVRRVQRDLLRRRMLAATRHATVVITNPTEYAVALKYDRTRMVAPVVVAKGRGPLAARIKAIARDHGIPTVENVPLAQALYRGTEVGETIPGDLFEAVAGVLAYLVKLRQLVL